MYLLPTILPWSGRYSGQRVHKKMQIYALLRNILEPDTNTLCYSMVINSSLPYPAVANWLNGFALSSIIESARDVRAQICWVSWVPQRKCKQSLKGITNLGLQ
jgi:hypothetical protein